MLPVRDNRLYTILGMDNNQYKILVLGNSL